MADRLFVYGTLAPGRPNEHILADIPGIWVPATVKGRLIQKGWGAKIGYPGIVPDEQGDEVQGFIFESEELSGHWARLDDFEGEGYERVEVPATVPKGTRVNAYIYAIKDSQL